MKVGEGIQERKGFNPGERGITELGKKRSRNSYMKGGSRGSFASWGKLSQTTKREKRSSSARGEKRQWTNLQGEGTCSSFDCALDPEEIPRIQEKIQTDVKTPRRNSL